MYGAASIIGCERGTAPPFVWGKRGHDKTALVVPTQSLADHCADVAAAFSALLSSKGIATRVSHLLAGKPIPPEVADRLAYLVYLHDIGKCNAGFQARWQDGVEAIGHITPLAAVIGSEADRDLSTLFFRALNGDRLRQWGDGVGPLLDAIISHHGRPWPRGERRQEDERHWREQRDGYDPIAAVAALRGSADADLAGALVAGGMPLPKSPPFVHLIAGLTQLADWIASSDWMRNTQRESREDWARRRVREIGIDPPARSVHVTTAAVPDAFGDLFSRAPHEHQRVTGALEGRLLVLECETGSGKTEAALWRFAQLFDTGKVSGLYFALPTRTAAVSIHERVSTFAKAFWGASAPPVILAVPGYLDRTASGLNAGDLPSAPDPLDRPEGDSREASPWAAENPKRFFAAAVSVGTIDQALLAALRVKHAHLRGATLMRHLLVVDEVHASDAYMRGILVRLLRDHLATGGYALLLSATLGAEARHELLVGSSGKRLRDKPGPSLDTSVKTPYPLVSTAEPTSEIAVRGAEGRKRVSMRLRDWLDDPDAVARAALDAAGAGAKVLVVRNTVDGAVAVQRALERLAGDARAHLFRVAGVVTLHHGRYAREDRRLLDAGVEEAFGKHRQPGGMIVVGTQTLEQSLDIDADLLITDLCPADVLLQRVGRLHRHSFRGAAERPEDFRSPIAIVLTPQTGLTEFLLPVRPGRRKRHGLGYGHRGKGSVPGGVYRDLVILEATRRLVQGHPEWTIPDMNRALVEHATHSEALETLINTLPDEEQTSWREHRQRVLGDNLAQGVLASDGVLDRTCDFMSEPNSRFDDVLATRLGADDLLLDLPAATVGPLHQIVTRVSVPAWMLSGATVDPANLSVKWGTDDRALPRLELHLDGMTFIYDRLGLRKSEDHTSWTD